MEKVRINKYLASCGLCSRRDADKIIEDGRVSINGVIAVSGAKVDGTETILFDGKTIKKPNERVVLAYNKPVGVTCTEKDQHAERKITDEIKFPVRVTYAGRLDKDSEGLILLTNDGDLINSLMRAANYHEKEYVVKINKEVSSEFIENMSKGLYLKDLDVKTRPCKVEKIGKYTFKIILTQGVNRQIRRMCKALRCEVVSLKRIRIANIELANLKTGEFRQIEGIELQELLNIM